jgi:hypothetical protein
MKFIQSLFSTQTHRMACLIFTLFMGGTVMPAAAGQTAVVGTIDPSWTSSALSLISVEKSDGKRSANHLLNPILNTDFMVVAHGEHFYRMERMDYNSVSKYHVSSPGTLIYQYSCQGDDTAPVNPHDLIFLSEEKAYLLRYGSAKAWIVNPSAKTQAEFKIGEIDFSAYADSDGVPEMNRGLIVNGKLYVTLQRIDFSGGWGNYVYHPSYIAVVDTNTDTEIDTGKGSDGMKGLPAMIKNSGEIQYLAENNRIYVQGSGAEGDLAGGIVSFSPETLEVVEGVDDDIDGDGTALYGGRIFGMAVLSQEKGFFVSYEAWGDCTVYEFNPATGAVKSAVPGLENLDIAGMANGIYIDGAGLLWVNSGTAGGAAEPSIIIYDPSKNAVDETIKTGFNPGDIVFCTTEDQVVENGETGGDASDGLCFIKAALGSLF